MSKLRKSTDIEIRLNKVGKLGRCVVCGEDSQDPFYGGTCQIGLPELFLSESNWEEWVCIFCAKYYAPQLSLVIRLARAAEDYCTRALGKVVKRENSLKLGNFESRLSLRVDQILISPICGICKEKEAERLLPEDEFLPNFPNLHIGTLPACWSCVEKYAPIFNCLIDLYTQMGMLSFLDEFFPTFNENQNPVLDSLVNETGWITCPNCKKYFSANDFQRLRYNRHITCGQKLHLVFS